MNTVRIYNKSSFKLKGIIIIIVILIVFVVYLTDKNVGAFTSKFKIRQNFVTHNDCGDDVIEHVIEVCEKRLPTAILVGSQKSGTSALLAFLNFHPQIVAPLHPDEMLYFSTEKFNTHSLEWYRNAMPCSTSDQVTMEKTPNYFYGNKSAMRIKQLNDKMKILIIMKDPVNVVISLFSMWKQNNYSPAQGKSLEDVVTKLDKTSNRRVINPKSNIISIATYILHVPTWLRLFPRDQILFLDGNMYEEQPAKILHQVEQFLKIRTFFHDRQFVFNTQKNKHCFTSDLISEPSCLHSGKGRNHSYVSDELKTMLHEYFKPFNLKLSKMINQSFSWM